MTRAREIQKNVTRPTSVVIMLLLLQGFKLIFPNTISASVEEWIINIITVIGGTGVIEKIFLNWKSIIAFFNNLFTKKEKGN